MTYQRDFLDDEGTEDCYGRTIWGSGSAASSTLPENVRIVAKKLFDDSIGWVGDLTSPRAKAYSVLGMRQYLQANSDEADLQDKMEVLSDSLISGFQLYSGSDWQWFEPYLTYGNAILPLALLTAAQVTGNSKYERIARRTMDFLTDVVVVDGRLEIIGNNGWYMRGGKRAWYDQQSVDAGYLICLYCAAYEHFTDRCYLDLAHTAYDWYFGRNRTGLSVYDPISGGCFDAVIEQGVNLNQGAESCVCFLLAQLAIERHLPRKVKR